jgi:threonine dehydrogenase-like Zn-dependent dehydrogenase
MCTPKAPGNVLASRIRLLAAGGLAMLAIPAVSACSPARAGDDVFGQDGPFWVGTWGAGPMGFGLAFSNQTVREIVRISVGSSQFRIRLTNEFGGQAVQIGDARVAISASAGAIKAGTDRVLTFSGSPTVTIPQGAAVLSDPVNLEAPNLTSLAVSLYLPQATSDQDEITRRTVNTWIRTSREYDAVIDFDAVVRDPANLRQLLPAFDSGDHLHPSDAGYQAMANAIDLRLFKAEAGED